MELCHTIGITILVFIILPRLNSRQAAVLLSATVFIPSVLRLLSWQIKKPSTPHQPLACYVLHWMKLNYIGLLDLMSFCLQLVGLTCLPMILFGNVVLLPLNIDNELVVWLTVPTLILVSGLWWENFLLPVSTGNITTERSVVEKFSEMSQRGHVYRYKIRVFLIPCQIVVIFALMVGFYRLNSIASVTQRTLHDDMMEFFRAFLIFVHPLANISRLCRNGPCDTYALPNSSSIMSQLLPTVLDEIRASDYLIVLGVQILAAYIAMKCCVFACQILMQRFAFSLPLVLVSPVLFFCLNFAAPSNVQLCREEENSASVTSLHGLLPR